jgi:adenine deaminase
LTNACIVNVFSGEIALGDIAVAQGYIVGFGSYDSKKEIDIGGRFVAPGFIDAQVHIESTMTCMTEFVRAVLPFGTTTVIADPHEIANVLGVAGINYMLQSSENQPMNIYFNLPSCVPATDMETSGAKLTAEDLLPFMTDQRILALAEMMNYPGVIHEDPEVLLKIKSIQKYRKPVDGHAPGLSGRDLYAYISAGISSDHECTTAKEAMEKLNAGMRIMIREGTGAKNLNDLLPIVNSKTSRRFMLCTDDRHLYDILEKGHIDSMVRRAIKTGIDPMIAIQMATINSAEYFGIDHLGGIGPGQQADLIVFSDIENLYVEQVYHQGNLVVEDGNISPEIDHPESLSVPSTMNVNMDKIDLSIPAKGRRVRVMDIIPDQNTTLKRIFKASMLDGMAISDIDRDILKIAVVERHIGSGNVGKGFVRGFGLKRGALVSSVAHDAHNIIVVGTNDSDMKVAIETVVDMGGGLAAVCDGRICAALKLPIAGLMSYEPVNAVNDQLGGLLMAARDFGSTLAYPFMTLSFLALPVIPELRITDKGLIDVTRFKAVPLFVD